MQPGEAQKINENEYEDGKDKDVRRGKEREVEKEEETEKEKEKGKGNDKLREKFINVTKDDLWVLRRVLSNKKGSLSVTFEKNSEANNKVYDLNENTMLALDRLEAAYLSFEGTWAKMELEIAEGDALFAASQEVLDELAKAQPYKDCPRDELKSSCDSHDMALMALKENTSKVDDTREVFDIACRGLEDARKKNIELTSKAGDSREVPIPQRALSTRSKRSHGGRGYSTTAWVA